MWLPGIRTDQANEFQQAFLHNRSNSSAFRLRPVMLVGFGVGLSWAATLLRWAP